VIDLLLHLPEGGIARELKGSIAQAPVGDPVTVAGTIVAHRPPPVGRGRAPYKVLIEDETGDITLVFFNAPRGRMEKTLPVGARRFVSGTIELWDGHRQMVQPARVLDERAALDLPAVEPIYGLTEGLTSRMVAKAAGLALARLPALPEWQDGAWLARNGPAGFPAGALCPHRPAARRSSPRTRSPGPARAAA
jgi:ATP-dependent DNA helicase RecG